MFLLDFVLLLCVCFGLVSLAPNFENKSLNDGPWQPLTGNESFFFALTGFTSPPSSSPCTLCFSVFSSVSASGRWTGWTRSGRRRCPAYRWRKRRRTNLQKTRWRKRNIDALGFGLSQCLCDGAEQSLWDFAVWFPLCHVYCVAWYVSHGSTYMQFKKKPRGGEYFLSISPPLRHDLAVGLRAVWRSSRLCPRQRKQSDDESW